MKLHQSRTFSVLLAAGVLVGGANIAAYAANGGKFVLGHSNKESHPSVLQNTGSGPALALKSRASAPAFSVSNARKIARLNADTVDGLTSSALTTTTRLFTDDDSTTDRGNTEIWRFHLARGSYSLSYTVGVKPSVSPSNPLCGFISGSTGRWFGLNNAPYNSSEWIAAWVSGIGTYTVTAASGEDIQFFCEVPPPQTFTLDILQRLRISVTKINGATSGAIVAAPRPLPRLTGRSVQP